MTVTHRNLWRRRVPFVKRGTKAVPLLATSTVVVATGLLVQIGCSSIFGLDGDPGRLWINATGWVLEIGDTVHLDLPAAELDGRESDISWSSMAPSIA